MGPSRRRLALLALLALGLAAGCSVESDEGGGGRTNAGEGAAGSAGTPANPHDNTAPVLEIEGESALRLGFGQSVELAVRLTESDVALRNKPIAFDLVGHPEDSSLSRLIATTNGEGIARVTLISASRPVMFEVRASHGSAAPTSFSVSVSSTGFGSVTVHARYEGVRAVKERLVLALGGVDCDHAEYLESAPKIVIAPREDSASLIALPAGKTYAVLAIAQSESGAVVARVCAEHIVQAQADDQLTLAFEDEPLELEHSSSLEITMEAGSAAAALGSSIRRAIGALVRSTASGQSSAIDAEGRFWLDSLDIVLRAADDEAQNALADALALARLEPMGSSPEASLAGLLEVNAQGAGLAGSAMASHVRDSLDSIVLYAEIGLDTDDSIILRPSRMEALPSMEGAESPSVRLTNAPEASVDADLVPELDTLELHELELSPRLGALAADALERAVQIGESGFGAELTALAGCTSLEEWLREQTFVEAAACDDGCVERVCALSMTRLIEASNAALEAQDEQRPRATLMGSLVLTDGDGDLLAERMDAERIDGLWAPAPDASLGDTLRGTAIAHATHSD